MGLRGMDVWIVLHIPFVIVVYNPLLAVDGN